VFDVRSNNFNNGGSLSPKRYLDNKSYFDECLIKLLEEQLKKIEQLNKKVFNQHSTIINRDALIKVLNYKLKHFKVDNYNLRVRLSNVDLDIETIIKEQDEKYDKLEKEINDELHKSYNENIKIHDENQKLKEELDKLRREVERLKKITKKDSTNSSLAPSSDLVPKKPKSLREKSGKKVGGQISHELHKSKLDKKPSRIIERTVEKAPTGAIAIKDNNDKVLYYATQEIDIIIEKYVVETRYFISESAQPCPNHLMVNYKINPTTYSNKFISTILYLNSKGTIPLDRLCLIMNELTQNEINLKPSTVVNWSNRFNQKAQPIMSYFMHDLLTSKINCVDESGWKVNSKQHWMHVLCNERTAFFTCTKQRSGKESGPISYLSDYKGYLVHDHYKPYYSNLDKCTHIECNAHIIRYLNSSIEFENNIGCAKIKQLFQDMLNEKYELINEGYNRMSNDKLDKYTTEYHQIIDEALDKYYQENPNMPNKYKPDYVNLLKRLKEYDKEHLAFINDFGIPFDNNLSERMIRGIKTKKKVSGQHKSISGALSYATIHSINQTCNLRKMNTLKTIEGILNGENPFDCFSL
jgi:hypothetical protein